MTIPKPNSKDYQLLLPDNTKNDVESDVDHSQTHFLALVKQNEKSRRIFLLIIGFQSLIIMIFLSLVVTDPRRAQLRWFRPPALYYSPAQEAIEYESRVFNLTFHPIGDWRTAFQWTPSEELDNMWQGLHNFGVIQLNEEEAARLPNKTMPIPDRKGEYGVFIDVFHQIHCLDMIRQALNPTHYPEMLLSTKNNEQHIAHCVQSLREYLMCSGDVTVLNFEWDEDDGLVVPTSQTPHSCVNFDKLKDWANQHKMSGDFDFHVRPPGV